MKTGSSPEGAFNYINTIKRGDQRMIAVIMGSGDWSDQTGEEIRHTFGNALVEKMYKDFSYKKVLSKGEQKIDGKKYDVEKDVYATVKKGQEPKISVKDDQIVVDNGLKTVSPKIKATSVKATKVKGWFNFGSNQKGNATTNTKGSNRLPVYFWFLCLVPVGLLYLIYLNEKGHRQKVKERKQARQSNK